MEMEDAVILAKYLRDVPGFSAAFASYERLRRRRVERIVAEGARQSGNKALGPVGTMIRDLMVRWILAAWSSQHARFELHFNYTGGEGRNRSSAP